jgi:hypothetical protein
MLRALKVAEDLRADKQLGRNVIEDSKRLAGASPHFFNQEFSNRPKISSRWPVTRNP